ncbi:MAG: hypothetical protein QGH60_12550 [Phycisphaerae bacterium]|jgi:hypothetical protein|nr:hypothetical protein [Phycisphaerae bacterium]
MSDNGIARIKPAKLGTLFALLTILYAFALGAAFGLYEKDVKGHLKAEAEAVKETVYKGDQAKMDKITAKSWVYCKRAHMHAAGLGAIALALIVFMAVSRTPCFIKFAGSLCIGLGALGYSVFWTLAALTSPGLGSTGDAKEALFWLAQPSAGLCVVGVLFAFLAFFVSMCSRCGCEDENF